MSVDGIWENEYHSTMTLSTMGNRVVGRYLSHTGSPGTFEVLGWQTSADPTTEAGQAVCLAIEWHSIDHDPPDNSWHWVSGLSGQLSIENGVEKLVLAHAMVASIEFPGLCPAGTYIDKLTYVRKSPAPPQVERSAETIPGTADRLVGNWLAPDGTVLLVRSVTPNPDGAFGWVLGVLVWEGIQSELSGFTDINAVPDRLNLQSVVIVGLPSNSVGPAVALAGTLDLVTGQLTLLDLESHSTDQKNTYVQTTVSSKIFNKRGEAGADSSRHGQFST